MFHVYIMVLAVRQEHVVFYDRHVSVSSLKKTNYLREVMNVSAGTRVMDGIQDTEYCLLI
jgi:hypothetical protein